MGDVAGKDWNWRARIHAWREGSFWPGRGQQLDGLGSSGFRGALLARERPGRGERPAQVSAVALTRLTRASWVTAGTAEPE